MMYLLRFLLAITFFPILISAQMSGGSYSIPTSNCNIGSGERRGNTYAIVDALGQGITGQSSGSNYTAMTGIIPLLWTLVGTPTILFASDNNSVFCYPNPWKKNSSNFGGDYIKFDKVSQGAYIKIYNIAGELVKEIPVTEYPQRWNIANEKIASGVYIYTVTGGGEGKSVGKIGIVKWE
ncbi:T9SS type A sorting domain-containing protein [Candidatus Desantisbacteria bacterium]|nr:T9SS type A sorting domain-containing protein [Candidatus Desantisbacteria bacterium]